jgi:hypothetical protein
MSSAGTPTVAGTALKRASPCGGAGGKLVIGGGGGLRGCVWMGLEGHPMSSAGTPTVAGTALKRASPCGGAGGKLVIGGGGGLRGCVWRGLEGHHGRAGCSSCASAGGGGGLGVSSLACQSPDRHQMSQARLGGVGDTVRGTQWGTLK